MAAPKGNQYAKNNLRSGRPPRKEWTDEILTNLGEEMVKWFKENKEAYWIQDFAQHKEIPSRTLYKLGEREVFRDYYERAKDICSIRIAKEAGQPKGLNVGIAQRFINAYFYDVREIEIELEERRQKAKHEGGTDKPKVVGVRN